MEYRESTVEGFPHTLIPRLGSSMLVGWSGSMEERHLLRFNISRWLVDNMPGRVKVTTISEQKTVPGGLLDGPRKKKIIRAVMYFSNIDDLLQFKLVWGN